jgi:hypothetical protein
MTAYILRNIDPALWQRVKARAHTQRLTVRQLILHLLRAYVNDQIRITVDIRNS